MIKFALIRLSLCKTDIYFGKSFMSSKNYELSFPYIDGIKEL